MSDFSVRVPTIPVPFHELLKVVAIVDREDAQTRQLLDRIAAEKFEIEMSDWFDRNVSEDATVGSHIAWIDGEDRRGVYQDPVDGRIRFHTYVVRE